MQAAIHSIHNLRLRYRPNAALNRSRHRLYLSGSHKHNKTITCSRRLPIERRRQLFPHVLCANEGAAAAQYQLKRQPSNQLLGLPAAWFAEVRTISIVSQFSVSREMYVLHF